MRIVRILFGGVCRVHRAKRSFHFLDLKTWWQRLLQLFGFLLVGHNQSVQETRAPDLEFGVVGVLLYFDGTGVLSARLNQKVFHFLDFFRHLV